MIIRIRLKYEPAVQKSIELNRQAALVTASLMTPVALMAWSLGAWRIAADLNWAGAFVINSGVFSRWQVWIALGIAIQFAAFLLHRVAGTDPYDGDGALF